jgi:hypothetical protein
MSTIHVGYIHPTAARKRLAQLIANDETHRHKPAITLPGRPRPQPPVLAPPRPRKDNGPLWVSYLNREQPPQRVTEEAQPSDAQSTWSRARYLRMNAHFVLRVERAFQQGAESRTAAGATVTPPRGRS